MHCAGLHQGSLVPDDTWAPLIIVTGRASEFGDAANFTSQLSAAAILLACDSSSASPGCNPHGSVELDWKGQKVTFYPSNGDGLPGNKLCKPPNCEVRLPEIDGVAVDVAPSKVYDGPHLSSVLGSGVVTTRYTDDFVVVYDFNSDSITSSSSSSKTDDVDDACTIRPGTIPLDTAGDPVHAHGAGVHAEGDVLYLLGTSQKEAVPSDGKPHAAPVYLSRYITLYATNRSNGLCRWKFLGNVASRSDTEKAMKLPAGVTARVERPKLARAESGDYVIWAHVQDSDNSSFSDVAIYSSKTIEGPYQFRRNLFANGRISKDSTVFTDSLDNSSYFVRDLAHQCDAISPFTADGLGVGELCSHTGVANACKGSYDGPGSGVSSHPQWLCEGVSMFRDPVDARLFMMGSHLSGWRANGAMLFVSSEKAVCGSNSTPWTYLGNPAVGPGNDTTYMSQSTFVLPWNQSMAVAMLDRWHSPNETQADYVWLPLRRSAAGEWTMRWEDSWAF